MNSTCGFGAYFSLPMKPMNKMSYKLTGCYFRQPGKSNATTVRDAGRRVIKFMKNNTPLHKYSQWMLFFFPISCFDLFSLPFLWPHYSVLECTCFFNLFSGKYVTPHIWCLSIKYLLFIDLICEFQFRIKKNYKEIIVFRSVETFQFL